MHRYQPSSSGGSTSKDPSNPEEYEAVGEDDDMSPMEPVV